MRWKNRKKTDKFELSHDQALVATVAMALDGLDQNECSPTSSMAALTTILLAMEYPKLEAHASAVEVVNKLNEEFRHSYFIAQSVNKKVMIVMAAVATAERLIAGDNIDENIKKVAAEALAKETTSL